MNIKRPLLSIVLSFLFVGAVFAAPLYTPAHADELSSTEPVQIAQTSDDKKKPKEGEDELGEDDC